MHATAQIKFPIACFSAVALSYSNTRGINMTDPLPYPGPPADPRVLIRVAKEPPPST